MPVFKDKHLRLCVVAALTSGTATVAEAVLLPPKPLKLSASWNCQSEESNDWLCKRRTTLSKYKRADDNRTGYTRSGYSEVSPSPFGKPEREPEPLQQMAALPVFRPEPDRIPEKEVPAGLPSSDASESAVLIELLNSPDNHYVLQWLAANERAPLEELKRRYPVLQQATIAQYKRSGRDWYVLLDGPYDNRGAAMAALESPPRAHMAKELYPWTRSIASILRLNLNRPEPVQKQLAGGGRNQQRNNSDALNYEIPAAQPAIAFIDYNQVATSGYQQPYQLSQPAEQMLAFGQEFDDNQSYPNGISPRAASEMYASISPAYHSSTDGGTIDNQQKQPEEIHYFEFPEDREAFLAKNRKPEKPVEQVYNWSESDDVLSANPRSYTIEWISSSRKASLERARRRYKEFRDTQILYYRKFNRDRYVLVSKIFGNRHDAVKALSRPSLAKISSRFAPKVKKIGDLQQLTRDFQQKARQTVDAKSYVRKKAPARRYQPAYRKPEIKTPKKDQQRHTRVALRQEARAKPDSVIYNAPRNSYTIQWFAANRPDAVEKMKARFPELASAQTVHFRKNNKDWYVLVQGQYRSSKDAIAAIQSPELKQAMLVLHPWTRPVNSFRKLNIVSL